MFTAYEDIGTVLDDLRIIENFVFPDPGPSEFRRFDKARLHKWSWFLFEHRSPSEPVRFIAIHAPNPAGIARKQLGAWKEMIEQGVDYSLLLSVYGAMDCWDFSFESILPNGQNASLQALLSNERYITAKLEREKYLKLPEANRRMSENGDTNDIALIAVIDAFGNYRIMDAKTHWRTADDEDE